MSEQVEYRTVSTLAVVSLLLGVASAAAFAGPLLLAVPVAAVGAAVVALARIQASGGYLTGASVARWGLALAVACGVGAAVREPVRNAALDRQALEAVEQWIGMLAQRRWEAALGRLTPGGQAKLRPPTAPGEALPSLQQMRDQMLQQLGDDPLVELLARFADPVRVAPQGRAAPPSSLGSRITIQNVYRIEATGGSAAAEPLLVTVQLVRAPDFESDGTSLRIDDWGVADAASP